MRFKRRKSEALLIYLAVTGRPHTRDTLATLIAGETDDSRARQQLRNTLVELYDQVGDYLIVEQQMIAFARSRPHRIDVAEFEAALADATDADDRPLRRAMALYRDEFLAGFTVTGAPEFDDWLVLERERLRDRFARGLQWLLDQHTRRGETTEGIACARRLLALEPWSEEAHRALMLLLARGGQLNAALAQYETCRRTLARELGVEPGAETSALHKRLRLPPVAPPQNLPTPTNELIGREAEVANLIGWLADPERRLLTVAGLGGSGKTRLALDVARRVAAPVAAPDEHPFANGVHLVPLEGLGGQHDTLQPSDGAVRGLLAGAIARSVGLTLRAGGDPFAELVAALRSKALLLVLDGAEHVLAGAPALAELLERVPRLKLLVTTRVRLRLLGEWVLDLAGLDTGPVWARDEDTPAGRLLLRVAVQVGAAPPQTGAERDGFARLCALTQGLPLALILAAQQLAEYGYVELADAVAANLDALTATLRDLRPDQQGIRAVLDQTWHALLGPEQAILCRLTVFRVDFSREAALAVTGATPQHLASLRERALLRRHEDGRYHLHGLVRQYAAERLATAGAEERQVQARQAAFYATFLRQQVVTLRRRPETVAAIEVELGNLRAAWEYAVELGALSVLEELRRGLGAWHDGAGRFQEWAELCAWATARVRADAARAEPPKEARRLLGWLLADRAQALIRLGQKGTALPLLDEAREHAQAARSPELEAACEARHGRLLILNGDVHGAQSRFERALAAARQAGSRASEANALSQLGHVALLLGFPEQASSRLALALALDRESGDRVGECTDLTYLGANALYRGAHDEAEAHLKAALVIARDFRYRWREWIILNYLGVLYDEALGRHRAAEDCFAHVLRISEETGDRRGEEFALITLGGTALFQGDAAQAERYYARALPICQALGDGLGESYLLLGRALLARRVWDDERAIAAAEAALELAQRVGVRRLEANVLRLLGRSWLGLGQHARAAIGFEQARELSLLVGNAPLAAESAAGLAATALAEGDHAVALAHVAAILDTLQEIGPLGATDPAFIYLTCYRVLDANDDPRAATTLAAGRALILARAVALDDPARAARYLENAPSHRALLQAWHERYPDPTPQAGITSQSGASAMTALP